MYAEYFIIYNHGQSKEVEHVREIVPDVSVAIFAVTFSVETVGLCDATRLMVAADEVDSMWVAKLEADEEGDRFDRKEASVDIIT